MVGLQTDKAHICSKLLSTHTHTQTNNIHTYTHTHTHKQYTHIHTHNLQTQNTHTQFLHVAGHRYLLAAEPGLQCVPRLWRYSANQVQPVRVQGPACGCVPGMWGQGHGS